LAGICISVFLAACGQGQTGTSSQGGADGHGGVAAGGNSSTSTVDTGGNAGTAGGSSGSGGSQVGGNQVGGNQVGGNQAGGSVVGAGGKAAGGSQTGGGPAGSSQAGGGQAGGVAGGAGGGAAGAGGSQAGGSQGQGGGAAGATGQGGATSSGGQVGGASGNGGAGVGGATVPVSKPKLVTSAQNAYWQEGQLTEVTTSADITINDTSTSQTWDGFGGTFNEAGWDVLSLLDATERDRALNLLFGADGTHFAFGRIPIGASDYAIDRYTLNETANDYTMDGFSIERDKKQLIPYIKAALALNGNLRLWASPWTPPTWMKDNKAFDGGNMKDDANILKAHALYLAKFVEEYAKVGLKIEAIHPQNEPNYETRYPSCLWSAALFTKFIRDYLGPTFAERSVTAQIFVGTMSNPDSGKDPGIVSAVTADSAAMKFVKGFGMQWGMIAGVSGVKSKGLPIWETEHKCGNYPWETATFNTSQPPNDHAYGEESWGLIRDWIKAGVNAYSAWNMVLDTKGWNLDTDRPWPQNALLTVDRSTKKLNLTPAYYAFRHFAQFVAPGAKVVASGSSSNVVAFKNPDGSIVVVLYNSGGSAQKLTLGIGSAKVQLSVPAHGFATVNR
jgi:glucosylceramidase